MNKKYVINRLEELKNNVIEKINSGYGNIKIKINNFKKHLSFVSDIILKSDYSKIEGLGESCENFEIDFKTIILVGKNEKVLNKLLNKTRKNSMLLAVDISFHKKYIYITYKILFDSVTSECAYCSRKVHYIIESEIFSEYNNVTEEYLNNVYKVAENFKDKFTNINIGEQYFIDFINYSSAAPHQKNQIKELISGHDINCAAFTDMIFDNHENKILLEFIKMLFEREYSAVFNFNVIDRIL